MYGLRLSEVEVNRKILADLAINDPDGFVQIVDQAKESLLKAA